MLLATIRNQWTLLLVTSVTLRLNHLVHHLVLHLHWHIHSRLLHWHIHIIRWHISSHVLLHSHIVWIVLAHWTSTSHSLLLLLLLRVVLTHWSSTHSLLLVKLLVLIGKTTSAHILWSSKLIWTSHFRRVLEILLLLILIV